MKRTFILSGIDNRHLFGKIPIALLISFVMLPGFATTSMASTPDAPPAYARNPDREVLLPPSSTNAPIITQQGIVVSGLVSDEFGDPLPGVTVVVKGTTTGITTDIDGQYVITVPNQDMVLVFSYIGYTSKEITVGNQQTINVSMAESVQMLSDVVVVAYGVQKKESIVGAISQVKGGELTRAGVPSVGNSLAGRVPGMVTVQQTGMPGGSEPQIFIRGLSSFTGNNQPLVLVDGIERPMGDIDPSEIESVSVLKDASATAVYGVKGGNGVILITSKRGQEGKMEISVNYDATIKQSINDGIQERSYPTLYARDLMYRNQNDYGKVLGASTLEHYRTRADEFDQYIYPDIDAWDRGMKDFTMDHRFSVSARGGTTNAKYYLTLSYLKETDLLESEQDLYNPDFRYERVNYRMNFDFNLTKTTQLSISSSGYVGTSTNGGNAENSDGGATLNNMYTMPPYASAYIYPAAFVAKYPDVNNPVIGDRVAGNLLSPGADMGWFRHNYKGTTQTRRDRLGNDIVLTQKLDFITKGLNLKANFSYNNYSNWSNGGIAYTSDRYVFVQVGDSYRWDRYIGQGVDLYSPVAEPYQRTLTRNGSNPSSYDYVYGAQLNYFKEFGSHTVTALGLFERRISQNAASFPHYEEKWSARATYDYLGKYMLEATLGISGSERFAPANRFGYFPSVAVGWNAAKEKFFQDIFPRQFSTLKMRYSYGESGNDQVNDFLYISDYTNWNNYTTGTPGTSLTGTTMREGAVPNTTARWERAKKHNLGVDFGFFDNSLTVSAEFYSEYRDGILMSRKSVNTLFGQGLKALNVGEVKRHGYEVDAKYYGTAGQVNYWLGGNFNFNENRIVNQDEPALTLEYQKREGKPIGVIYSSKNIGYYQNLDDMYNYSLNQSTLKTIGADMVLDFNGDGKLDGNDAVAMKYTTRPDITYGFSGGLEYNHFEMNFLIQGVSAVERNWGSTSNPLFTNDPGELYVKVKERDDIWTPDNRNAEYANWGAWNPSSKAVVDASYLRLKSLEVAYSFSGKTVRKLGLSSARIALQGSNLLTWAPGYIMGDPENETPYVGEYQYNFQYYPIPRRFTMSLKVNF